MDYTVDASPYLVYSTYLCGITNYAKYVCTYKLYLMTVKTRLQSNGPGGDYFVTRLLVVVVVS